MQTQTTERTIQMSTPRQQVWDSIIQPDQLVQWLVPNLPGAQLKRDNDGKVQIYLGEMGVDFAILQVIDPQRRASIMGLPDGVVTAQFILEDYHDGTRVTITLEGIESLPKELREDRLQTALDGWEKSLENLKAHVSGSELPFPQAFVGPLFGYWREVQQKPAIERSIWIAATRERVWQAITDPKQLQQWFSPNTPWELSSLKVGGKYYVIDTETNGEMYVQIIEHMDPPHQFITHSDSGTERTIYTLEEENGGTRLALTHTGYEEQPDASRWNTMEQNSAGFGMMLQNVKAVVEGEALPFPWGF